VLVRGVWRWCCVLGERMASAIHEGHGCEGAWQNVAAEHIAEENGIF
jgi:hypothetical protein